MALYNAPTRRHWEYFYWGVLVICICGAFSTALAYRIGDPKTNWIAMGLISILVGIIYATNLGNEIPSTRMFIRSIILAVLYLIAGFVYFPRGEAWPILYTMIVVSVAFGII